MLEFLFPDRLGMGRFRDGFMGAAEKIPPPPCRCRMGRGAPYASASSRTHWPICTMSGLLRQGDKDGWTDHAALGMCPADQTLGLQRIAPGVHRELVEQMERLLLEGPQHVRFQGHPFLHGTLHPGIPMNPLGGCGPFIANRFFMGAPDNFDGSHGGRVGLW